MVVDITGLIPRKVKFTRNTLYLTTLTRNFFFLTIFNGCLGFQMNNSSCQGSVQYNSKTHENVLHTSSTHWRVRSAATCISHIYACCFTGEFLGPQSCWNNKKIKGKYPTPFTRHSLFLIMIKLRLMWQFKNYKRINKFEKNIIT